MTINAKTDSGRARALLQLGGQTPIVNSVNFENVDGLNGVSGGDVGKAEVTLDGSSVYRITGTAVVTDRAHPAQSAGYAVHHPSTLLVMAPRGRT